MNHGKVHFVGFAIGKCGLYRADKRNPNFFLEVLPLDGEEVARVVRYETSNPQRRCRCHAL